MKIRHATTLAVVLALIIIIAHSEFVNAAEKGGRQFYLTKETFNGSEALSACAKGFHMASLWEIFDVTTLRYDTTRGVTSEDSGFGPPTTGVGWIRTGWAANNSGQIGTENCLAWTSTEQFDDGTAVALTNNWDDLAVRISPWTPLFSSCASENNVWCVHD